MAQEEKTKQQLQEIIGQQIGVGGTMIVVHPNELLDFTATVLVAPAQTGTYQAYVENLLPELRRLYKLKK